MRTQVTERILQRILTDNVFSLELANKIGVQQQSVRALARRKSKLLTLFEAILFYKDQGYKEDEIFDVNGYETTRT